MSKAADEAEAAAREAPASVPTRVEEQEVEQEEVHGFGVRLAYDPTAPEGMRLAVALHVPSHHGPEQAVRSIVSDAVDGILDAVAHGVRP